MLRIGLVQEGSGSRGDGGGRWRTKIVNCSPMPARPLQGHRKVVMFYLLQSFCVYFNIIATIRFPLNHSCVIFS